MSLCVSGKAALYLASLMSSCLHQNVSLNISGKQLFLIPCNVNLDVNCHRIDSFRVPRSLLNYISLLICSIFSSVLRCNNKLVGIIQST